VTLKKKINSKINFLLFIYIFYLKKDSDSIIMNKLKKILRKPLEINEFVVYIDTKTVKRFRHGKFYDIYFNSKILDKTTNKFYTSNNGYIKGNFDFWLSYSYDNKVENRDNKTIDSEICIYFDKPILEENRRVQFLRYMVSNFFQKNQLKHIIKLCRKKPVGYKNIFIHKNKRKTLINFYNNTRKNC